ncbi:MAG: hypothetical protein Q8J78_06450 [Moraxellaceae bacterium]|nr:hypothetical protein [Moraxellaceae bacterium]
MPTCLHCSARIPAGRTYCHPHYQEALRHHDERVVAYRYAKDHWNRLGAATRTIRDQQAEDDELSAMASLVAVLIGGYLWFLMATLVRIDGLWGLVIMFCTGYFMLSWSPARRVTGKLARAAVVALPSLICSMISLGALCIVSDAVRGHALPLLLGTLVVVLGNSLFREWSGRHQASGMPVHPVEPRP